MDSGLYIAIQLISIGFLSWRPELYFIVSSWYISPYYAPWTQDGWSYSCVFAIKQHSVKLRQWVGFCLAILCIVGLFWASSWFITFREPCECWLTVIFFLMLLSQFEYLVPLPGNFFFPNLKLLPDIFQIIFAFSQQEMPKSSWFLLYQTWNRWFIKEPKFFMWELY